MARGTPGLRKVGNGWKNNSLYRGNKRVTVSEITPEQKAGSDAYLAEACEALSQGRAEEFFAALRDREARIAVEGDGSVDDLPFGEEE